MDGEGWYHVVSRTAFQLFKFDDRDKGMFVRMMRRVANFCGVEVLNYCAMTNHFHILLHIPRPTEITEAMLLERVSILYGTDNAHDLRAHWEELRKIGNTVTLQEEQDKLRRRMGDISEFMKSLKQRYSIWYRHEHESFTGTLWEGRYRSIVVQGSVTTLSAVSAYIDLNPVRAGIVNDPADYKWSGYGAATAGDAAAMRGIARVFHSEATDADFVKVAENHYREVLYSTGAEAVGQEKVREVLASGGKFTLPQLLRCKVRHFIAGVCLGDEKFVESVFEAHRGHFGPRRKSGARGIGRCEKWCGVRLCTARKLVKTPLLAGTLGDIRQMR